MSSLNKAMLIGNLGQDPEVRTTQGGSTVCTLRLATNEKRKDQRGEWVEHVEWHTVVCFGKTAEATAKFLQKGRQVYVEGKIRTEKWQDKDGRDRWSTKVYADDVRFLSGGRPSDQDRHESGGQSGQGEEIPF